MSGMQKLIGPLRRRIATMIGHCILHAVNANAGTQTVQVSILAEELMDGVEHKEPYGFTSNPLSGAEGVLFNVAGQRGAAVAINLGNREFRLKGLKSGEVALYTDEKDSFIFKRGNIVELTTKHYVVNAEKDVTITTKDYHVTSQTHTIEAAQLNLRVDAIASSNQDGSGGAKARLTMDIEQDGYHTSTGDQIAGSISQIGHTHICPVCGHTGQPE